MFLARGVKCGYPGRPPADSLVAAIPVSFSKEASAAVPIPLFDGNHPWEKIPFQFSLHVLEEDGGRYAIKDRDVAAYYANTLVPHLDIAGISVEPEESSAT